ncbi:twin-arginine translocation signal domain-containing protein [Erythrobacter sp. JK5]|uniref:Acg family FMN-binding oxidoreductase n=1 Tax=Erythrobacter sp. JK5 TaxID=2829500 RepID=UPI001BA976A3|nr:twin-arginine translocation signal domain-containing protein [Erythrobacter sp. JK5]QUL38912.1 twin-arginine translocation signal domain-containing protein [Erythrobacter sp. JK5]
MAWSRRQFLAASGAATTLATVGGCTGRGMATYDAVSSALRAELPTEPRLQDLIRFATLAPNSHNTQPWKFRPGHRAVEILPDLARACPATDPDDHHVFVTLGCAAENLLIAGNASGMPGEIVVRPAREKSSIEVALGTGQSSDRELCDAIALRQSTRSEYDSQPLSLEELRLLEDAAAMPGVHTIFITDRTRLDGLLAYVIEANSLQCDDPAFVEELRDWIRFNPEVALDTRDGLFTACSGNPTFPTWMGRFMFDRFFSKEAENEKYASHLNTSAGAVIFVADVEAQEGWIAVGRSFQRFALQATALGICHAHLNMPIEVAAVRPQFANWLGIEGKRPDLVIRFGKASPMPTSLRRPAEAVMFA